jgi:hypothetical protein
MEEIVDLEHVIERAPDGNTDLLAVDERPKKALVEAAIPSGAIRLGGVESQSSLAVKAIENGIRAIREASGMRDEVRDPLIPPSHHREPA